MLEHKSWDHAIDLKLNFILKDCKVYPLSPKEQKEQDKFLEENLRTDPQNPQWHHLSSLSPRKTRRN